MLTENILLEDRYLIMRQIGQGGMGAVFEAVDQRLGNRVALKQILIRGEQIDKAFGREAKLLAQLRHPALPRVIDYFYSENDQFLVMDYISGTDLAELLNQRGVPISVHEALLWADQILIALDYLHRQTPPVIHRDIKPQNLKLALNGDIILLDFGLAKGSAGHHEQATPLSSLFGYTLNYAPIEQLQGSGTNSRSDLYSLAATLYHLLTNKLPLDALSRASAVLNQQPDPLVPAHELNRLVPIGLSTVLKQAMSLGKNERYPSATAMREAIQSVDTQSQRFALPVLRRAHMVSAVLRGARILWIDDNPSNNTTLCEILTSFGITVDLARSSEEARYSLSNHTYNLIISDIARGESPKEGLILLQELQDKGSHPKVVFFTGRVDKKPLPEGAFAITDHYEDLFHYVFDILERERI